MPESEYVPMVGDHVVVVDVKHRDDMRYIGMKGIIAKQGDVLTLRNDRGEFMLSMCIVERDRDRQVEL